MSDHGPVETKHFRAMNKVAAELDRTFQGFGFCLLVFDKNSSAGRMNYICNCNRDDMVTAMKEFIANYEADKAKGGTNVG